MRVYDHLRFTQPPHPRIGSFITIAKKPLQIKTLQDNACAIIETYSLADGVVMSKVSKYLNQHILGEVVTDSAIRARFSTDASVLTITPEMIVYPRVTNDIRKVARFAWQLAEKGHVLSLTARGAGTDDTGGAIGAGAIIAMTAHMNRIFEYDAKQKLVRVQPGVNIGTMKEALALQGAIIPVLADDAYYTTIGGAVGYNTTNHLSGKYGAIDEWIDQIEVVLANGDVLQTKRLNKRELSKKKGLPGLEGDIYRKLDALIDDNQELIQSKLSDVVDTTGYSRLRDVKQKDGSFDLLPLLAGSQGTLGIVSEMILRTEFLNEHPAVALLAFSSSDKARDAVDELAKLNPDSLEYFDGLYFEEARAQGKQYGFYEAASGDSPVSVVLCATFGDFSKRARAKALKKVEKLATQFDAYVVTAEDEAQAMELAIVRDVTAFVLLPDAHEVSAPPLFDGVYVPFDRFEDFAVAVRKLAKKHSVTLPLYVRPMEGIVSTRPNLQLKKVGDKQKIFKLLDEYANLVVDHNGVLIAESNEGRFKSATAFKQIDDDIKELFSQVKAIFDPFSILNPGVKQPTELKKLVADLRSTYDTASIADYVPHS